MSVQTKQAVRFVPIDNKNFYGTLRKRVNAYFKENDIPKYGNWEMKLKTIVFGAGYLIPYTLMLTGVITNTWAMVGSWLFMGIMMTGIGCNVGHDANHGSYAKNRKVNDLLGNVMYFLGMDMYVWKIQHNVLHHTYTNVEGMDDDININGILRFSPHKEKKKIHKFQYIYAWLLYMLMSVSWLSHKEFAQLKRYKEDGHTKQFGKYSTLVFKAIIGKIFFISYSLVIPLIFFEGSVLFIIACYMMMLFTSAFTTAVIFQLAHVMPDADFPVPGKSGNIENDWAIHQLTTTCNFAPKNKLVSWYVGGLNYQIEHHLFPNICHIHHQHIAPIVEATAKEFGIPYVSYKNTRSAIFAHARMLKQLGSI